MKLTNEFRSSYRINESYSDPSPSPVGPQSMPKDPEIDKALEEMNTDLSTAYEYVLTVLVKGDKSPENIKLMKMLGRATNNLDAVNRHINNIKR